MLFHKDTCHFMMIQIIVQMFSYLVGCTEGKYRKHINEGWRVRQEAI